MIIYYLFLTIPVRPIISKSTGPIFVKFAGLAKICFSIRQGTLPRQLIFVGFIQRRDSLGAGG